jgi:hypothetical protein
MEDVHASEDSEYTSSQLRILANSLSSLAIVEMKTLLRDIYSRYRTAPADGMTFDMSMDDQIFTSRPKDQKCNLKFVEWVEVAGC